jgi:hypothetical protein
MGSAVIALYLLRYWRNTQEPLFAWFSAAFVTFGLNWLALAVVNPNNETRHLLYLLRLAAFVLILIGIIAKNRRIART